MANIVIQDGAHVDWMCIVGKHSYIFKIVLWIFRNEAWWILLPAMMNLECDERNFCTVSIISKNCVFKELRRIGHILWADLLAHGFLDSTLSLSSWKNDRWSNSNGEIHQRRSPRKRNFEPSFTVENRVRLLVFEATFCYTRIERTTGVLVQ